MLKAETKSHAHPTKITYNSTEGTNPHHIAQLLNQYFQSVFKEPPKDLPLPQINIYNDPNLTMVILTPNQVLKQQVGLWHL